MNDERESDLINILTGLRRDQRDRLDDIVRKADRSMKLSRAVLIREAVDLWLKELDARRGKGNAS